MSALESWTLGSELGRGGMGIVYAARHVRLEGDFAIKEIRPELVDDPKARAYFLREGAQALRLEHPNLIRTLELMEVDRRLLIAMERLSGMTVQQALDGGSHRWPASTVRQLLEQSAAGIGHAHALGLVHRDIKPSNLFLMEGGGLKILDFGICRVVGELSLRSTEGGPPGTPIYMPPEVLQGAPATPSSDVFSLGLVCFRLLAGRLPHDVPEGGSPWAVVAALMKAYTRDLPRVRTWAPEVPADLDLLLARMLSVDPLHRPRDGAALAQALSGAPTPVQTALGVRGLGEAPGPAPARPRPPRVGPSTPAPGTALGVGGLGPSRTRSLPPRPPPLSLPPASPTEGSSVVKWVLGGALALALIFGGVTVWRVASRVVGGSSKVAGPQIPPTEGWIEVTSAPAGAMVRVQYEGQTFTGVTPTTFRGLFSKLGVRPATVEVSHDGYAPRSFTTPVIVGLQQRIHADLQAR